MMLLALLLALQAPAPATRLYAHLTLATGTLEIVTRDTGTAQRIEVTARSATPTEGRWHGARARVRSFGVLYYTAVLRQIASDLESGRWTTDTLTLPPAMGADSTSVIARCARAGCWLTTQNPGLGAWRSEPPLGPADLRGLARALEAAARRDSTFTPNDADADSLPFVRVVR